MPQTVTRFVVRAVFVLSLLFGSNSLVFAATNVSGAIPVDTTWTAANSPYVVSDSVAVPAGLTLTLEPGTIVKFSTATSSIAISGNLVANGIATNKIYFTSIKDDTVGGDTNSDGSTTSPAAGDWFNIILYDGSSATISHSVVTNSGYFNLEEMCSMSYPDMCFGNGAIYNRGGALAISNSQIVDNGLHGIYQLRGSSVFTSVDIVRHSVGVHVSSGTADIRESNISDGWYGVEGATRENLTLVNNIFSNNRYPASINPDADFIHSGNSIVGSGVKGWEISGLLTSKRTWTSGDLPYIISGSAPVYVWGDLTIDPGAVVKFNGYSSFDILGGKLTINGTATDKVSFTSINDDTIGGDTNGDGAASSPAAGDWANIALHPDLSMYSVAPQVSIHNAIIRYGGAHGMMWGNTLGAIYNNGGNLTISGSEISNNADYSIYQIAGTSNVSHSEISGSGTAVYIQGGNATITGNNIHDNIAGVNFAGVGAGDARGNYWGDPSGPRHTTLNPSGTGNTVVGSISFNPWLTSAPDLSGDTTPPTPPVDPACTVDCYSNIMFLPGVMGSKVYEEINLLDCSNLVPAVDPPSLCDPTEKELWASMSGTLQKRLELDINGKSVNSVYTKDDTHSLNGEPETGLVDEYVFNIYRSFINDLRTWKNDEKIIEDYAFVPYDWRLSLDDIITNGATSTPDKLSYTATQDFSESYMLKQLQALQKSSRTKKVTIVAHSEGGLVAKALIQKLKDSNNPLHNELYNMIDKVILISVPQIGTPEGIAGILHGVNLGYGAVMTTARSRDLSKNMPVIYNMIPSAEYFKVVNPGYAVDKVVSFENKLSFNAQTSKYGVYVSNEDELRGYVLNDDLRIPPAYGDTISPAVGNVTLYDNAQAVHATLDKWQPASSTKLILVAGWGKDTLAGIDNLEVGPESTPISGVHTINLRHVVDGDGTVVEPSALWTPTAMPNVERWWVDLKTYNGPFFGINREHRDILEVPQLRDFIKSEIDSSLFDDPKHIVVNSTSTLAYTSERLHFTLHSPLTLGITDVSGRYTGLDSVTGEIKEEIPDTTYKQYGEVQFISVPAGLQYTLKLKGYETGTFALGVEKQVGNTVIESTTFQAIPTATSTAVTMDIAPVFEVASSTLKIDQNNDGTVDVLIDANPSGITIYDLTAPVTTVTPIGTLGSNGYYTSAVTVDFASDDIALPGEVSSGVASTRYSLDGGIMWDTYSTSTPLVIATEGTTTLQYYSVDNNGNSETPKTLTLNIDTVAPTIFASDVSAEQLTPSGTNLVITATSEDNVDANPALVSSVPLSQTFTMGTTEIALTATDIAGNTNTTTITVTIFSSPTADPDGDCVVNADDVNPFDSLVFANLVLPNEYSFWEKEKFTLPFSVAGKGMAKLSLSSTYYKVSDNPIRDAQGVVVSSISTEVDGIITITFPQNTKELTTYALELATKKGNTRERDSIKKKRDNETDHDSRHELEKELDFASAPITLSLQSMSCPNTTSQAATVNIYDKQQNAQVQYKYKDTGSLDFVMKSDDVIKIKKGQPLVLTVKVTGAKKNVQSDVSLSGNFTTLSVIQEDEHHDSDDRKQKTFTLFYPLSTQTALENISVNLIVGGVTKSAVLSVKFED